MGCTDCHKTMSQIILRNKANPAFTRTFPKRAWDLQNEKGDLKQQWEYAGNVNGDDAVLPTSEVKRTAGAPQTKIFVPPEALDVVKATNKMLQDQQVKSPVKKVAAKKVVVKTAKSKSKK